jgi:hypothetical protein
MRIKKVITAEHQAKMIAGNRAAKSKRRRVLNNQEVKANVIDEIHRTKDDINEQLVSVHSDAALIRKLFVMFERALINHDWANAFRLAGSINVLASSVSRRIEVCAAKNDVIVKMAETLKRTSLVVVLMLSACGSADEHPPEPEPVVAGVILIAPPAPAAPSVPVLIAVVSKPAPVYRWRERERDKDDDDDD